MNARRMVEHGRWRRRHYTLAPDTYGASRVLAQYEVSRNHFWRADRRRACGPGLGKGQTAKQQLTLPEPTKASLEAWLQILGSNSGPLFPNLDRAKKSERLTGVSIYRLVRSLGEVNGIKTRPHGVRHTAITDACKVVAEHEIGLEEVLDFSRHSRKSISILLVYRDRERNIQGQSASMIAAQVGITHQID